MSPTNTRSRLRQATRSSAARLTPGRARVSVPWIEALEDRTLLSYAAAASDLQSDLGTLSTSLVKDMSDAIPLVGSQLTGLLPVTQLLVSIENGLTDPLMHATSAGDLVNRLGSSSILGPLLNGASVGFSSKTDGTFTVTLPLAEDLGSFNANPNVDLGLGKFLTFTTSGGLVLDVKFDYLLAFTVQPGGSAALDAPSLGLPGLPGASLGLTVTANLMNFTASGTLTGLLHAEVSPNGATNFTGTFGATVSGSGDAKVALVGSAEASLGLALSFVGPNDPNVDSAPINPQITATLEAGWSFDGFDSNPDGPPASFGHLTKLSFEDVKLDVGALLPHFLNTIISDVQSITEPLQPIVDFFETDIPGLDNIGVHVSLLTLIDPEGTSALGKVLDLINFINKDLPAPTGGGTITLGSFSFIDQSNAGSGTTLQSVLDADSSGLMVAPDSSVSSDLLQQADGDSDNFFSSAMSEDGGSDDSGGGFSFPIVTDPSACVWELLAGGNPDLVRFTLPPFYKDVEGSVGADFGVFGVDLEAELQLRISLSVGYDTQGIRDFIASKDDVGKLLDGLYVDNGTVNGGPISGISLNGHVTAGASLLGVTLSGGITANGDITIAQNPGGKARIATLLDTSLGSIFAAKGTIDATLDLSYGFDLPIVGQITLFSYNLASATLLDFNTAVNGDSNMQDSSPTTVINIDPRPNESSVHVYQLETQSRLLDDDHREIPDYDPKAYQTTEDIVVDYGDRQETYKIGSYQWVVNDYNASLSYWALTASHPYNLLLFNGQPFIGSGGFSGGISIVIDNSVYGAIENFDPTNKHYDSGPVSAILIGGNGGNHLEYHATGGAYLVGGGGSNTLIGGEVEYGNYLNSSHLQFPDPYFNCPTDVLAELALLVSKTGNEGKDDLVDSVPSAVMVGGPDDNTFEPYGNNETIYGGAGDNTYEVSGYGVDTDGLSIHGAGSTNSLIVAVNQPITQSSLVIGPSSAPGVSDPLHSPISITDPAAEVSITAEGLSKISYNHINGSVSIHDLSQTSLTNLQLGLLHGPPDNPQNIVIPNGITITGGGAEDDFDVASKLVQPPPVAAPSGSPTALVPQPAFESTTVQDQHKFTFFGATLLTSTLNIGIDNIVPQDVLTLDGGAGNNQYNINLDLSATFLTKIKNTGSKPANINAVTVNGLNFTHPEPLKLPASLGQSAVFEPGNQVTPVVGGVLLAGTVYGGGDTGDPIYVQGGIFENGDSSTKVLLPPGVSNLFQENNSVGSILQQSGVTGLLGASTRSTLLAAHRSAKADVYGSGILAISAILQPGLSFANAGNLQLSPTLQANDIYISGGEVKFDNVQTRNHFAVTTSARVDIDSSTTTLSVTGTENPNTFYVSGLYGIQSTALYGSSQGDVYNVSSSQGGLRIVGGGGNDVTNVAGFSGNLKIDGGGNDVVNLGKDASGTLQGEGTAFLISGNVSVGNNFGLTTLNVYDNGDGKVRNATITSTAIKGLAPATITYDPASLAALNISGSIGYLPAFRYKGHPIPGYGNSYDVLGTPGLNRDSVLVTTTLSTYSHDTVDVGSNHSVSGIQGTLVIDGVGGAPNLNIDGSNAPQFFIPVGPLGAIFARAIKAKAASRRIAARTAKAAVQHAKIVPRHAAKSDARVLSLGSKAVRVAARKSVAARPQTVKLAPRIVVLSAAGIPIVEPIVNGQIAPFPVPRPKSVPVLEPILIAADHITGLAPAQIHYSGLASLTVSAPGGGKFIDVEGTPNQGPVGSVVTSVISRGNDIVTVGGGSERLDAVQGALSLSDPLAHESLTVDDAGDRTGRAVTIAPGLIRGLAPADITYATGNMTKVSLAGGTGGNTFTVQGTTAATPVDIDGGAGSNTLAGPDVANKWHIAAADAGKVHNVTFKRVGNLVGGSLADKFKLGNASSLSGGIDGGGGVNALNMSAQNRDVVVNLAVDTATAVAGRVTNIANATGGMRNSILVGTARANTLTGGAGNNLIIGRGGLDQLLGGSSDNILIGGTTSYDLQAASLEAIMTEFDRPDENFAARLTHLLSGDGPNDPVMLNPDSVQSDGDANVLTSGTGANWFFTVAGVDVITPKGRKPGDVVTPL